MDLESILAQLRAERDLIEEVIIRIEDLERKSRRGRGRPPGPVLKRRRGPEYTQAFSPAEQ